jgi:hypothetical protein
LMLNATSKRQIAATTIAGDDVGCWFSLHSFTIDALLTLSLMCWMHLIISPTSSIVNTLSSYKMLALSPVTSIVRCLPLNRAANPLHSKCPDSCATLSAHAFAESPGNRAYEPLSPPATSSFHTTLSIYVTIYTSKY